MITFTVDCITTKTSGLMGKHLAYIKQAMTGKPSGYQFMAAYKKGYWDGNICLYNSDTRSFPSGLLYRATQELQDAGQPFEVVDNQPIVEIDTSIDWVEWIASIGFDYREYQVEAIQAALEYRRGILKLATNAGKTLLTAGIIKATGCNACVVVPTKPLLHQTAEYYTKVLLSETGKVGDGYSGWDAPIVVTTMASFYKVAANRHNFNTLIIDECHHSKAKSIAEAAEFIEAPIRIGVSGTPLSYNELNDLTLMGITGPLLYEVTNTELIEQGYSVKPVIVFHEVLEPSIPKKTSYQEAYQRCIVDNFTRNDIIATLTKESDGLTLILVERLEHVANLLELLPDAIPATGDTDTSGILEDMRLGKCSAVIATNVFSEGVDVDGIDSIILAGAGVSHIRLLQRIGRGLRTKSGKSEVTIHDFIDSTSKHLLAQSEQRLTTYEKEHFEVRLDT